jgi:hypothetical protein
MTTSRVWIPLSLPLNRVSAALHFLFPQPSRSSNPSSRRDTKTWRTALAHSVFWHGYGFFDLVFSLQVRRNSCYFLPKCSIGCRAFCLSYLACTWVKQPKHKTGNSPSYSADVRNEWTYSSRSLYALLACTTITITNNLIQPLKTLRPVYRTGVPLPSRFCISYIIFQQI